MGEHAASSPATPDEPIATGYAPRLLSGHLMYSTHGLAEITNTSIERASRFWITLGFQAPTTDDEVFPQRDLEAFSR